MFPAVGYVLYSYCVLKKYDWYNISTLSYMKYICKYYWITYLITTALHSPIKMGHITNYAHRISIELCSLFGCVIVCNASPDLFLLFLKMMSSNGNISRGHQWIPLKTASDAGLWCFLGFVPEETVERTIETPVIWDTMAPTMMSL